MPDNKNVIDIAKIILKIADEKEIEVNNFQLQALLYFGQCESYKKNGRPLISSTFRATEFGVVEQGVFNCFDTNGMKPISINRDIHLTCSSEDIEIIRDVLEKYKGIPYWDLFDIIKEQQPWILANKSRNANRPNPSISNLCIA